jgi:hypothetical protein
MNRSRPEDNRYRYDGRIKDPLISEELQKVEIGQDFVGVFYKEPDKPRDGMMVIADGVKWNPSDGAGLYFFHRGQWRTVTDYGYESE